MDSLPTEVLRNICSCLKRHDSKNFRLVCKAYSAIGAQFALPTNLFAYLTNQDLERIVECSKSEHLARCLLSLEYAPLIVTSPSVSEEEYEEAAELFYVEEWPRLAGGYSRYKALVVEQKSIMEKNKDYLSFLSALPRFSQLRRLTLYCGDYYSLISRSYYRASDLQELRYPPDLTDSQAGIRHLEMLLRVLSDSPVSLETLKIDHIDSDFFEREDAQLHTIFQPIANLKCLNLTINGRGSYDVLDPTVVPDLMCTGVLRKCLSALTHLHELAIHFSYSETCEDAGWGDWEYDSQLMIPLIQIVPSGSTLTNLTSLELSNIVCERQDMMEVLLEHKETLRELRLQEIYLRSTSWIPLLDAIRRELLLKRLCIGSCIAGHFEGGDRDGQFQLWRMGPSWHVDLSLRMIGFIAPNREGLEKLVNRYVLEGGRAHPKMANPLTEDNTSRI